LFEDGKHQLLLAHDAGVLDFHRFGKGEQIRRGFVFKLLKLHFLHGKSKSRFYNRGEAGKGIRHKVPARQILAPAIEGVETLDSDSRETLQALSSRQNAWKAPPEIN
jgi:hypothetical protein